MLKFCIEQWDKNKNKLENHIRENIWMWNEFNYKDIVEKVVDIIFNDKSEYSVCGKRWDYEKITEIDNGDYQGTLLYLIPLDTYQPSRNEYLMTSVYYGSCSGCDTLQAIQGWDWHYREEDGDIVKDEEKQGFVSEMMNLCLHLVQNTIKPYNNGWESDELYNQVEEWEER